MEIKFYRQRDEYGFLSNFYPSEIFVNGDYWPTVEHLFQAMKFEGTPHYNEIRLAKTPMTAAEMGRDRSRPLRGDWERVKNQIMWNAVYAKFTQNSDLQKLLLETGDAILIEHTKNDSYWGDGGDGSGRNQLGETLMSVRFYLRHRSGDGGK